MIGLGLLLLFLCLSYIFYKGFDHLDDADNSNDF